MSESSIEMTDDKIFEAVKEILTKVAPSKTCGQIDPQTSLVEEFAFDSIDIVKMFYEIRMRFFADDDTFDVDSWLYDGYSNLNDKKFAVSTVCELISENLNRR